MSAGPDLIHQVEIDHYAATCTVENGTIVVRMRGNADVVAKPHVVELLAQVDAHALAIKAKEAVVDVKELYFMNSTCLSLVMRWVSQLSERTGSQRFPVRFVTNKNLRWQQRSLSAISTLARGLVTID
jgi:anti-anti-sigma factor